MRIFRAAAFVLAALWLPDAGWTQTVETPEQAVRSRIEALIVLAQEGKFKEVAQGVTEIKKKAEDIRNFRLLEKLYDLMSISAGKLGDKATQVRGDFQNTILRTRTYGPLTMLTASAEVGLAVTYNNREFERPLQIVAANSLNTIRHLRTASATDKAALAELQTMAHILFGQSYQRVKRPELALRQFRAARALGKNDALSESERQTLNQVIADIEKTAMAKRLPFKPGACRARADFTTDQQNACLKRADQALLDNDSKLAERILRELIADATPDKMATERVPAALSLHLLMLEQHAPDSPAIVASVDMLGNKLATNDTASASLLSMRTVAALMDKEQFDERIASLCGHIARRAARTGNEDLALRFLDAQIISLNSGVANTKDVTAKTDLLIERTLVLFDAASFADLNGYTGLAEIYRDASQIGVTIFAESNFEKLTDRLGKYWDSARGFVFPGPGAASELLGRIASKSPATPERQRAIIMWIASESVWRGNDAGSLALAESLTEQARQLPGQEGYLAELLFMRAEHTDDPIKSAALDREAYALLRALPNMQSRQVEVLLRLAEDSRRTGDYETALRLIDEAQQIADAHADVDNRHRSTLLIWRAEFAMHEKDLPRAIAAAEQALRILDNDKRNFVRARPAADLAELYAHVGRIAETREIYQKYIFPQTEDPLKSGEAEALRPRIVLAALESFFGPTKETLTELEKLFSRAAQTASRDDEMRRTIIRAQAFALYGLGDGAQALRVGQQALSMRKDYKSEKIATGNDRPLLETMVGAAFISATKATSPPRPNP